MGLSSKSHLEKLRQLAESKLALAEEDLTVNSPPVSYLEAIHELHTYQIELEIQNEELRHTESELAATLNRYSDLYNFAPIGYVTLSSKLLIIEANLTFASMLSVDVIQLLKAPLSKFIADEDQDIYYLHRNKIVSSGKPQSIELRLKKADGSIFWVSFETTPEENDGQLLMSISEITERKRAEEALKKYRDHLEEIVEERTRDLVTAKTMAEASNVAKSAFLANMSHELRTPLNSIIGFSDLMADGVGGPLNNEQKEYLDDISRSGAHLLRLINDILDLSKIEAGKSELELSEFSFKTLLEESLFIFREKVAKHNLELITDIEPNMGNMVADRHKIRQVMYNLITNAIKFTPDGGKITVAVRRASEAVAAKVGREGMIEISVSDTGIGISREDLGKLFQPFQQLEPYLTKKHQGTGLGLSLCKHMVEMHGGTIWAESESDKGSVFTFTIPRKAEPPE